MTTNVIPLTQPDGSLPPALDAHEVAAWLRELADAFDANEMNDVDYIRIIGLRRDTGMPIEMGRSIGRRITNLEWGGVLAYLQHVNSKSYWGED